MPLRGSMLHAPVLYSSTAGSWSDPRAGVPTRGAHAPPTVAGQCRTSTGFPRLGSYENFTGSLYGSPATWGRRVRVTLGSAVVTADLRVGRISGPCGQKAPRRRWPRGRRCRGPRFRSRARSCRPGRSRTAPRSRPPGWRLFGTCLFRSLASVDRSACGPRVREDHPAPSSDQPAPSYEELAALVGQLRSELARANERITELEARLGSDSTNSSTDGFTKPAPKSQRCRSGRKPGGQDGHRGPNRRPDERP